MDQVDTIDHSYSEFIAMAFIEEFDDTVLSKAAIEIADPDTHSLIHYL